jgi:hypothetical protein
VALLRIGVFPGKLWAEPALIPKPPVMLVRSSKVTSLFRQSRHPFVESFSARVVTGEQCYRDQKPSDALIFQVLRRTCRWRRHNSCADDRVSGSGGMALLNFYEKWSAKFSKSAIYNDCFMENFRFRSTTRLVGLVFVIFHASFPAADAKPVVTFTSPCSCEGNHGVSRWAAKTDTALPPPNTSDIRQITPADMFTWQGIGGGVTQRSRRLIAEEKWFSVTGRVEKVRIEDDGDVHIELKNVDGRPGGIVVELPLGETWCAMR